MGTTMRIKDKGDWVPAKRLKIKENDQWKEVATIKANFGEDGWHEIIPPNAIILYDLPEGSLPSTATLCDGTGGTPNILSRYVMITTDPIKIFDIGGTVSHLGSLHGESSKATNSASPGWQQIKGGGLIQNSSHLVNNSTYNTAHTHTITTHSHNKEASNHRKRKYLQPTMFDDVIRNGAVFLNLYGIMEKLSSVVYKGFLELANNNTAYLTDVDDEAVNHTHGIFNDYTDWHEFSLLAKYNSKNDGTYRCHPLHYHSMKHDSPSSGAISFPNQNFYTGIVDGKLYWDELPYGTVCFFTSDLLPTGWQPLIEIKKYSNGLVTSTVNTESLMVCLDSNIDSDTSSNPKHNHVGTYTTGAADSVLGPVNGSNEYAIKSGHTHTVQDNHSIEVDHTPPYIKLFVGYKVLPTYTVTFDANGGEGEQEALTKTYQIALTMPTCTFTKTGYVLKNWNTRADGNGTAYTEGSSTFNLNEDITLYAIWEEISYDIAPGTYTPSVFKNLIAEKVSLNGSRTVSKSFTATVNGQTITVPVGAIIYYRTTYSGGIYIVGFGTYTDNTAAGGASSSSGFTNYKTYIVDVTSGHGAVASYSIYSITIGGGGIKFN